MTKRIFSIDERIKGGAIRAVIIKSSMNDDGIYFATEKDDEMQLGVMNYEAGHIIKPHFHKKIKRTLWYTSECLHIDSGRVLVEFFNEDGGKVSEVLLEGGDTILILEGGHGIKILQPSRIIESKTGPYIDHDADKTVFDETVGKAEMII